MEKGIHEECGVMGVFNHPNAAELVYYGLRSLQHRGQEGAGIVSSDGQQLYKVLGEGLVSNVFDNKEKLNSLKGSLAIGHVRYKTFGGCGIENVQPFLFRHHTGDFAVCHNGNLTNSDVLKKELEYKGHLFHSTSDSEIIAHLVKKGKDLEEDRLEVIKSALLKIDGAFSFLLITKYKIFAMRDKLGFRPLCYGRLNDNTIVVASESCALDSIGAKLEGNVAPGEIFQMSEAGITKTPYTPYPSLNICAMEYIYFSRPDSDIEDINVHAFRKHSGAILSEQSPVEADIVIAVPDSSTSAAMGYSEKSNIPLEMGLVKNKYVGRTFIEPSQELRDRAVDLKLSAVRSIIKNKRVIVLDDSIVRGTTMRKIVRLLRKMDAKEVHVRIASPQLKHPCHYGVDISTYKELISHNKTPKEVCDYLKADSLEFLSEENLEKAIRHFALSTNTKICTTCFNGKYLTKTPSEYAKEIQN